MQQNWLLRALNTTVGKKFVMGITGLLLCGFLVFHLAGNLLLYAGPEAYNAYAHTLHSQEQLLMVAEAGLAALFLVHLYFAVRTTTDNRAARNVPYAVKVSKQDGGRDFGRAETWMWWSGVVVLGFLLVHLADFTFQLRPDVPYADLEPFDKAIALMQNPVTTAIYVGGCGVLLFHLAHGFWSAFQSLGVSHPKYSGFIKGVSLVFAVVIGLGFISFPIWVWWQ